jgi:hypothetical protein
MGVPLGGSIDTANPKITGAITASALVSQGVAASTGTSAASAFLGGFNLAMWGTFSGTVLLEKTYDGGATWVTVSQDVTGTPASYTLAWTAQSINLTLCEVETQVAWRLRCTAFTSGTLNYRLSQGGGVFFTGYPGMGGMV